MNIQQSVQHKPSSNGFTRRKVDKEMGMRTERPVNGAKLGGLATPSRDRLMYVMTYLIGHHVEIQVKNGSIISGIFHGTSFGRELDFVLKMAQVIKDGSTKGQKPASDIAKMPQMIVIPAREFVQVIAKDVLLNSDEVTSGSSGEKGKDLMIDSVISRSHHVEMERELEPWMPDEDDPECPELDNIFDGPWKRNWDQFQANEALFGVKSTFDEELYTTKLERGPQMREREREASRIAREIEGEETQDLHLVEERGIYHDEDFDLDEESRYSAVRRQADDEKLEHGDSCLDLCKSEIGVSIGAAAMGSYSDNSNQKVSAELQASSTSLSVVEEATSQISDLDVNISASTGHFTHLESDCTKKDSQPMDERLDEKQIIDQSGEKSFLNELMDRTAFQESRALKSEELHSLTNFNGSSSSATAFDPSSSDQGKKGGESSDSSITDKIPAASESGNPTVRPGSSMSSTSECTVVGSGAGALGLSPSSSVASLSSEKSTLKPNAKEFKLNPNAKSFTPSSSSRPHTPVSEGSMYYHRNVTAVQHMHVPVGMGIGPFGQPPIFYSPQVAPLQSSQSYIHPNGPLYGQQMILGQDRPVYYVPNYPPEMQYNGRNFQ